MGSNTLALPPRTFTPPATVKALVTGLVVLMVLTPAAIAIHAGAYDSFFDNSLAGFGMWGTFAIHMWTRPDRREILLTVVLGFALRLVYDLAIGERGYVGSLVIGMGIFLGLASLAVLAVRSLEKPSERRVVCRRSLGVIALLTYLGFCLGFYLPFARAVLPRKFDYYLYQFDGALGIQPAFLAGRLFARFRPLFWIELMVYNCFGFWFSIIYAAHANTRVKYPVNVVKMLVANALIGFSLYFLCPAMGPKYAFPAFPDLPAAVRATPVLLWGVPNAMPSLHFGGAVLLFWFSQPWKWLHRFLGLFAVLTAVATLGLGEHYLIDLVVAVPYALAILAFSSNIPQRKLPLAAGAAMVLFWLATLRSVHFSPVAAWALVLATVGSALLLQRRLAARLWTALE